MNKLELIKTRLADERGKEVVILSHCLLNMNTRYLGGAFRRGCVEEIISGFLEEGVGIVQMKCPEQLAWGGVYKKTLWIVFDTGGKAVRLIKSFLLRLFIIYTKMVYRRIASETVKTITDYTRSGIRIRGIIGVDGSPTCGVTQRLDISQCFEYFMAQRLESLNRNDFNSGLYAKCKKYGPGLYMESLMKKLKKRKIDIPFYQHSLLSEMENKIVDED